jgi:NADH-dependent peroxiredoxin subunit F
MIYLLPMKFDLVIIGGGPAGVAAAVYAARKKLKTVLITDGWGGQSSVSEDIQNWIGTPHISGADLGKSFKAHLEEYAADQVTIADGRRATAVTKTAGGFATTTSKADTYESSAILITVGSERRKLIAKGAADFEHKGLTYCASCDGPLFSDRDVIVVGGGNAAFESAAQLLAYTKSVTLLNRGETFRADPVTVEKVSAHPNMRIITNTEITEVTGDVFVSALTYTDTTTKASKTIPTDGIFVEIGLLPNTSFLGKLLTLTETGQIVIDPWTQATSIEGIWAAGDCTNVLYHQNNIAVGDAVRALEDIYSHLRA